MQKRKKGFYERFLKRPLDFCCALVGLIMLCPVMLVVWVLVRVKLGSPVIFRQKRPGLNEKIFILYKFRTMTDKRDKDGNLLPDEVRLTKFGKWLRSTSLDELPELINILKGDMSVVGPRPLLLRYLPYYTDNERHRHDVRPGLTGLAQISGRNFINWEERFQLDLSYIENLNVHMDTYIFCQTLKKVFVQEDIMEAGTNDLNIGFKNLDEERK